VHEAADGHDVELQALVQRVVITDDPRQAAEEFQEHMPDVSIDDVLGTPYLWIGTVENICEHVLSARERWGFSYFTVFNDAIEVSAPVVARLADGG
jgi:hypothetical protein